MSLTTVIQKQFIGLGDALVKVILRYVVTEEKGSPFFHGILSPSIRRTARRLVSGQDGPALEIGCGDGRLVIPLARESGREVVGLDLFEHPFCAAVEQRNSMHIGNLELLRASGMELPFGDGSFESVICVNTLNSVPTKEAAWDILREMVRVCRPNGRIVVDYRNETNPVMRYRSKWRKAKHAGSALHQITFRDSDMVAALDRLGARVDSRVPLLIPFHALAPAVVLRARKGAENDE